MDDQTVQREHLNTLVALVLLTALLGQVEIRPFSENFRFSLAVPALSLILLYFPATSPLVYSFVAAAVMLFLRGILAAAGPDAMTFTRYWALHFPVLAFYLTFGVLFSAFRVRKRAEQGATLFFALVSCETAANLTELFITHQFSALPLEQGVFFVVLVGMLRSGATAAVYRLTVYWQERHDRKQHKARYRRMLLFFSTIKTDLLFFHKSMDDIESAMKHSYSLYEKLKDCTLGQEALSVSRRIHEVKKEYQRIIVSMERALSGEYAEHPMRLSDIFSLLRSSTERLLTMQNIPVTVSFSCRDDWMIGHYYTTISIINNLVINAVEAMSDREEGGIIAVTARREGNDCVIDVADTGPGIPDDLLDCIFEPGFSTKFDPNTGAMSTGIGLPHVKAIVENHCDGKVMVRSGLEGTLFRIRIPEKNLVAGGGV